MPKSLHEFFTSQCFSCLIACVSSEWSIKKSSSSSSSSLISNLTKREGDWVMDFSPHADSHTHRAVKILSFSKGIENQYQRWQVWYLFKMHSPSLDKKKKKKKKKEVARLCRKLGSLEAVCFIGWTFTVTNDDSFYFYTPHSSESHPEIQHCHSSWLAQAEILFKMIG